MKQELQLSPVLCWSKGPLWSSLQRFRLGSRSRFPPSHLCRLLEPHAIVPLDLQRQWGELPSSAGLSFIFGLQRAPLSFSYLRFLLLEDGPLVLLE